MGHSFPTITEILKSTIRQLEETSEFSRKDPAVRNLMQELVRTIAQLDIEKSERKVLEFPVVESEYGDPA